VAACGSSAPLIDAFSGDEPVTCAQSGGAGSGTLVDEAGVMHPFGPVVSVAWSPRQSDIPGSIVLDDGATVIHVYGAGCGSASTTCPAVGEDTATSYGHSFQASWFMGVLTPDALDVIVDVAQPGDACWGGRYDITYGFDKGSVMGELKGWWATP